MQVWPDTKILTEKTLVLIFTNPITSLSIIVFLLIVYMFLLLFLDDFSQNNRTAVSNDVEIIPKGSRNTYYGKVSQMLIGDDNTVVGATDSHGNTIINSGGTAIGSGAYASPTGVSVGFRAGAGKIPPEAK